MDPVTEVKYRYEKPIEEAVKDLTGQEVFDIEKHWGKQIMEMGALRLAYGVIWALESRIKARPWSDIVKLTVREVEEYFPPSDDMDDTPLSSESTQND